MRTNTPLRKVVSTIADDLNVKPTTKQCLCIACGAAVFLACAVGFFFVMLSGVDYLVAWALPPKA